MGLNEVLRDLNYQGMSVEYSDVSTANVLGMTTEEVWRSQPYVRLVVSFLARNIAQLALHTFERVSDTDRRRVTDDPVAQILKRPNGTQTGYELIYGLVSDLKLFDEAIWHFSRNADTGQWQIHPISPAWVARRGGGSIWEPAWLDIRVQGKTTRLSVDDLLIFHGWTPGVPGRGTSPIQTLKAILLEQIEAQKYRAQVWQRGGRVGGVLTRPGEAPEWSDDAREKFSREWQANYSGDGPKAGGTPILEEGMRLERVAFNAREDQYIEAAKLSLALCAAVYHINPTMVGQLDNANYSNTKEFRKMLYGETLGPDLSMIEDRINTFLVPRVTESDVTYVEFNIHEKLQGSFEEQTQALQSAIGRPWMTADEGRAVLNMPSLGGDAGTLVTPLNVLVGGQASPRDSAPKRATKARPPVTYDQRIEQLLMKTLTRQKAAVLAALGGKARDWWDSERWDKELSDDLFAFAVGASRQAGEATMSNLGADPAEYDESVTYNYNRAVADKRAKSINERTAETVEAAISSGNDVGEAFDSLEPSMTAVGIGLVTALAAFGTSEAARQVNPNARKTWVVASANPRPEHAAIDGETVGLDDVFSNGARWPGDYALGADGVAGCQCQLEITV